MPNKAAQEQNCLQTKTAKLQFQTNQIQRKFKLSKEATKLSKKLSTKLSTKLSKNCQSCQQANKKQKGRKSGKRQSKANNASKTLLIIIFQAITFSEKDSKALKYAFLIERERE